MAIGRFLIGCSLGRPEPSAALVAQGSPVSLTLQADWEDLDRAVDVGLTRAQCAVVSQHDDGSDARVYELLTINHERGTLSARRDPGGRDARGSVPITLIARIGPSGNPASEALLIEGVSQRLEDLAGVEWAPIRE